MDQKRLFDLIPYQISKYNKEVALSRKQDGQWITYSSRDLKSIVDSLSLGFLAKGIKSEDKVAIISDNRPEWNFIDLALQQIGAISVPMYPTISSEDYAYIFGHASVKMIFAGDQTIFEKAKEAAKGQDIFTFDKLNGAAHWEEVMKLGEDGD